MTIAELRESAREKLAQLPLCGCAPSAARPTRQVTGPFSLVVCDTCGGRTREPKSGLAPLTPAKVRRKG